MATFNDVTKANQEANDGEQLAEPLDMLGDVGFLDAFPAAVTVNISGKKVELKPWSTAHYSDMLKRLTKELRERRMKAISLIPNATPVERFRMISNTEETEVTPDDLLGLVFRPWFTEEIILGSLKRAGISDDDAKNYYESRPAKANEMMSVMLSGLYTTSQFNDTYRRFMPVTAAPPRTFGQNQQSPTGGQTGPFAQGQREGGEPSIPSPSLDQSGDNKTGPLSNSVSDEAQAVTPAA